MQTWKINCLLTGTILLCACNSNSSQEIASRQLAGAPLETRSANSGYSPAFEGQTRAKQMFTKSAYESKIITKDLKNPWGIVEMADGRFLITEKEGSMVICDKSGKLSSRINGIPKVNSSGQGGLLGLVLDPEFQTNRMIYWTFSEELKDGNLTSVAKGRLSDSETDIENAQVIYRATPAFNSNLHYGSRILFDKTGNLIFSTGERSDKISRPQAQQLNSSLGKIIRITKDGHPAPGNPFLNQKNIKPEIYSYGHRNVQGLAFNPISGELWENEFGPRGGDELNIITAGKNYGWPIITYGLEYSGSKVGEGITQKAGLEQPVYYWDPVLSPSGMCFYSSNEIPEWKNDLFICGLNSNRIARLHIENKKVTGEESLLTDEGQRFRDIIQAKDGALYAITDEGRLYRIGKRQ